MHNLSVSIVLVPLALIVVGAAWPMICGNAAHTSLSPRTGKHHDWASAEKVLVKWKYRATGEAESSPVVSETKVFSAAGTDIFALDKHTGKRLWTFKAKAQVLASGVLAKGLYMIGTDDHHFYALDQEIGALKWKVKAGEFTGGASVDESADVVYAGSQGGLYAYGLDGEKRFQVKTSSDGAVNSSPAVDSDGNVFFGDDAGVFRKVDRTGKLLWKHTFESGVRSPAVLTSEGEVFLSNGDPDNHLRGQIVRMDPQGKVIWASNCEGGPHRCDSCWTAPQPVGNVVVAGCGLDNKRRGTIWGLDRGTGEVRWKIQAANDCQTSSPVHLGDGKTVVLGCTDGTLYAVNALDGSTTWTFKAGKGIWATPAMDDDGTLYVASHDEYIYALVPDHRHEL